MRSRLPLGQFSWLKLSLLALLLFIAGCTGDDLGPTPVPPSATNAPTPTSTPGPTATPFATATAVPSPTAFVPPADLGHGGTLKFAVPQGPPHMDPHLTASVGLLTWGAGQAYSRLFKFDTVGDGSTVICDLCSSWKQSAPLTFEITLRGDVTWQNLPPLNGRLLTAQDVVFSLERQATANYPNAPLLSNVREIAAIGDRNLVIRLESPDSETLEKLADSHSRIVSPEAVEVNGDLRRGPTIGTGPWMVETAESDQTRLVANPDYFDDRFPYLDTLEMQVIPSQLTRATGMRTKILDLAQVGFAELADAVERFDTIEWVENSNPAAGIEIALNTTRSPIDKLAVRKAMMLTWDPTVGVSNFAPGVVGDNEPGSAANMSVGLPLLQPGWQLPVSEFVGRFNDPETANTALTNAGLSPADNVVIRVGEYGQQYIDQANAMAQGLAAVGIRAEVDRVSTRRFGDDVWIGGDYDISVGSPPPISSTTAYLFAVHHSEGPWNTTGYADPEIDRLIEAQVREYDPEHRGALLVELQRRILEGAHRYISATRTTYWMWWDYVRDFDPKTPLGDSDFLTRVWLTKRPA
ncbi:MAG: ABC transporter substrate-binding protein [Chloroflexi bacterium]|nr:ABC transporter substrate-binding protein [Chloroflexota bacterium]